MARDTSKSLRNKVMYQIFVRNFSEGGTFKDVVPQLDRIRDLGVDIIWFAPIHPIGKKARKGELGSPYAISDYRSINPEYGTIDDFKAVVGEIHARGMKCIIDVVYNHTSPDSVLASEHPEWFYHKEDGSFGNHVGDWSDIIDLDYNNRELWDYQAETLKMWAGIVDGFRCDVAPIIPLEFWQMAREEVATVRPDCLWLSESVEPEFLLALREMGLTALSDSEIFRVFDVSYEYDVYGDLVSYVTGRGTLDDYAKALCRQEYIYPDNYVKLRFLENHDQPRAAFLFSNEKSLRNVTAFLFFQKGMTLLYAGEEYSIKHLPSLFDKDAVRWDKYSVPADSVKGNKSGTNMICDPAKDLTDLIRTLSEIKSNEIFTDSTYTVNAVSNSILVAKHKKGEMWALGVFSLDGEREVICVDAPDGTYKNLIDGKNIDVVHGMIRTYGVPIIILQ
ncbi:alpha-amylase family glycosyl hydrolase [Butyrivibrio sp. VCD2006]|uniref:alpha-amylase family glycosyl hydrolase n=1 Tax=Butyrivibrio sp. VCD2006 TaxID=1280664 RepID=UPI000412A41F|nr:alpha-amylase family glycosyl hydrolase [Butyrivibrio sp. VCD2006]